MDEFKMTKERGAVGSLALSMVLASVGVSIPNVALPTLAQEFRAPFAEVQWILLSYLLATTVLIVSAGRMGDLWGRRRVLVTGILLFTLASLASGFASHLWILIGVRVIQGLGAATMMSLAVALIPDTVEKRKTGSAMGLMGAMSAIGTASGPTVGGVVIAGFGWQGVFFFMAILGVLSFYLSLRCLPLRRNEIKRNQEGFDLVGTILLGITLTTYALGVSLHSGHFNGKNGFLIAIAFVTGLLLFFTERTAKSPLIRWAVFRDLELSSRLMMNIIVAAVMMSTLIVGPFYLSLGLGLEAVLVGAVMSVGPLMSIMTGLPAGRLVDHLGPSKVTRIGLFTMAVGASALCLLPPLFGVRGYIFSVAILSPGYQLFQASNNTAVMANVTADERGVFSGMLSLSRNMGLITGASMMGALFAHFSNSSQISTASSNSIAIGMKVTFAVATALISMALIMTVFLNANPNRKEKNETQLT